MNKTIIKLSEYSVKEIDFDDFVACEIFMRSNPELLSFDVLSKLKNINEFKYFFYKYLVDKNDNKSIYSIYQIIDNKSRIIGLCGFQLVDKTLLMTDTGQGESVLLFCFSAEIEKIVKKEILTEVIQYGFENLNLKRQRFVVSVDNKELSSFISELNFIKEALLRAHCFADKDWHDYFLYAAINSVC